MLWVLLVHAREREIGKPLSRFGVELTCVLGSSIASVEAVPSAADLVSWAGVCPGNHRTGGKRKSGIG